MWSQERDWQLRSDYILKHQYWGRDLNNQQFFFKKVNFVALNKKYSKDFLEMSPFLNIMAVSLKWDSNSPYKMTSFSKYFFLFIFVNLFCLTVALILIHMYSITDITEADKCTQYLQMSTACVFLKDHWWKGCWWKQNPWDTFSRWKTDMLWLTFLSQTALSSFVAYTLYNKRKKETVPKLGANFSKQKSFEPSPAVKEHHCWNLQTFLSTKTWHNYKHIL